MVKIEWANFTKCMVLFQVQRKSLAIKRDQF